jgi:hypothetical protein
MPFRIKYILCLETMVPDFVNIWENAMKNNLKIISAIAFLGLAALACQALSSSPTSTAVPVDTDVPTNTDVPATAPQPTQQEAPTSESNNLFADDFSPGRNSWGTGTDADSSVEYVDDVLNIQVFTKNYFVWTTPNDKSYENIHAEVTVINNGADSTTAFGIICNQQYPIDESNYYFAVTLGGQYAIAKAALAQTDVFLTNNDDWGDSDLIPLEADSYRVGADCGNGRLTLYVDGQEVASVEDSTYLSGSIALFVWSGVDATNTNVSFDDFVLTELP